MKKMCWFCANFAYSVEDLGIGSFETGAYGESFGVGCNLGMWELDARGDDKIVFARNLQRADKCKEFILDAEVEKEINN